MSAPLVPSASTELLVTQLAMTVPAGARAAATRTATAIWQTLGAAGPVFDGILAAARADASPAQATVLRAGLKLSAPYAASLNAADAATDPAEDILVPVLFAAIAVAELNRSTAAQFLDAFALGAEVTLRLSRAFETPGVRPFIPAGAVGQFGAALAVARLIGLGPRQAASALGLAAIQVSGIAARGTHEYVLSLANAARTGVEVAYMAKFGATGPLNGAEAVGLMINKTEIGELLTGLGSIWTIGDDPAADPIGLLAPGIRHLLDAA